MGEREESLDHAHSQYTASPFTLPWWRKRRLHWPDACGNCPLSCWAFTPAARRARRVAARAMVVREVGVQLWELNGDVARRGKLGNRERVETIISQTNK